MTTGGSRAAATRTAQGAGDSTGGTTGGGTGE
jgi:hypothetical protein